MCSGVVDARRLLDRGIKVGLGTGIRTCVHVNQKSENTTMHPQPYLSNTRSLNSNCVLNRIAFSIPIANECTTSHAYVKVFG